MSKKALIGYGRVSASDQNTAVQEEQLQAEGCEPIYLENITGRTLERPQLIAAMDYARAGDTLVTMKVDRLGRNAKDVLEIADQLETKGVTLVIKDLGVDTSTPMGKFFLAVSAAYAELDYLQREERQRLGIDKAQRDVEAGKRVWKGRGEFN